MQNDQPIEKHNSDTERVEDRASSKQREQAADQIQDGRLNEQKKNIQAEIQRTGKSKITGVKGAEGGPGFPSSESVFGDVTEQNSLRQSWLGDQRKTELIAEIKRANEQGLLIQDGGFVKAPEQQAVASIGGLRPQTEHKQENHEHGDQKPKPHRAEKHEAARLMQQVYGHDHLPIPPLPKPITGTNQSFPGKPQEEEEKKPKPQHQGSIMAGGPGPPGDDDDRKNKQRPWDWDPEHGTGEQFAKDHLHNPSSPADRPESREQKPDKQDENNDKDTVAELRKSLKDLPEDLEKKANEDPDKLVSDRIAELKEQIPAKSQDFGTTMATAVVEDEKGKRFVLVSTSEPGEKLRRGVSLNQGETLVEGAGEGHAEIKIQKYADQRKLNFVSIGATRPICEDICEPALKPTGTSFATPLKSEKKNK